MLITTCAFNELNFSLQINLALNNSTMMVVMKYYNTCANILWSVYHRNVDNFWWAMAFFLIKLLP